MSNAKLIVLVVHGMGKQEASFADDFIVDIRDRLDPIESVNMIFAPVYYQGVLQEKQESLWKRTEDELGSGIGSKILWKRIRKFLLFGFSDASTYLQGSGRSSSTYTKVHEVIKKTLADAVNRMTEPGQDYKVVILAHSLGCQVMSNYIYDAQSNKGIWKGQNPPSADEDFSKLVRFITFGCNMPLFLSASNADDIKPIKQPNTEFMWRNYYDMQDILGWPMKPLGGGYEAMVEDEQISVGGFFTKWSPMSHGRYWSDSGFLKKVVFHLRQSR